MSFRFLGRDIREQDFENINAGVLELADEVDSKSIASDGVRVQVPPPAPVESLDMQSAFRGFYYIIAMRSRLTCIFFVVPFQIIKKDETLPEVSLAKDAPSVTVKLLEIISFGLWQKDTVEYTAFTSDATSGVAKIEYYIDRILTEPRLP